MKNQEQLIRRAKYFDRFGIGLDLLNLIDFNAYTALIASANMSQSRNVLDFGCGRGIFAYRLLRQFPNVVNLVAVDLSHRCTGITQNRLSGFGNAKCYVGSLEQISADSHFDRIFCSFVLDTMPVDEIAVVLDRFHRLLEPGGLVCLLSASPGVTRLSRLVMNAWQSLYALNPQLVGGTQVISMKPFLQPAGLSLLKFSQVVSCGFCSEVVIARKT